MTNKEETLDWLCRLRSEIYVYMPKEWLIPMNNALDVAIDTVKREEILKQHLFELSFALDGQSSGKDYAALRRTHYDNQIWIRDNDLQEEYYKYFYSKLKEEGTYNG